MAQNYRKIAASAREAALKSFGLRLQEARGSVGLTQEAVADKLNVSTQTVRNWESGRTEPGHREKAHLASIYNKPVEWFFGEEGEPEPAPEDTEEEDIDILDPSLPMFFRGEWDEFTDEEREFIREAIRDARAYLKKRNETKGQMNDRS